MWTSSEAVPVTDVNARAERIPCPIEDDRGAPLHLGDRVRFGAFQLTVVGLPGDGGYSADVPPTVRGAASAGALLARSANGEIFRFDAPALHLHRVATRAVAFSA